MMKTSLPKPLASNASSQKTTTTVSEKTLSFLLNYSKSLQSVDSKILNRKMLFSLN